jgi:hypothetical protein
MDRQKVELEKADMFPESSNTEVSKLRENLLKHNNDLAQTDERQYQLEYKLEWSVNIISTNFYSFFCCFYYICCIKYIKKNQYLNDKTTTGIR